MIMKHASLPLLILCFAAGCGRAPDRPQAELVEPVTGAVETVEPGATREAPPRGPAVVYALSDESDFAFTGYKVGGTQKGSFLFYEGTITLYGDDLETAKMDVTIFMETLMTDDVQLSDVLTSDKFFNVEKHPEGRFVSSKVTAADDGFTIVGDLTLNGVAKTLSFPARISLEDGAVRVEAEFQADRQWWGLTFKGMGEHVMRDRVDIHINLLAEVE